LRKLVPFAVAAGYGVFVALLFAPSLLRGGYLTLGDGLTLALPAYLVGHGLWEPNIMIGYPWSSTSLGTWYPLSLLRLIPGSFNSYVLSGYAIASFGTFGLVSAATKNRFAGIVSGFVYPLGGFVMGHFGHVDIVEPAAWTPFVFWSAIELRSQRSARWIAALALSIAMCALAGQPQVLAYTLLSVLILMAVSALPLRTHGSWLRVVLLAVALGLGIAAIALVPSAELGRASVRVHLPFADFTSFSLPPNEIAVRLLFPNVRTDPEGLTELANGVGITALVLAILACFAAAPRRDIAAWGAVAIVGLVLSTGDFLGLAHITYHLPGLNLFRAQGRHALEFTLALAVLAGYGTAAIIERRVTRVQLAATLAIVGAGLAVTALADEAVRAAFGQPAVTIPLAAFALAALGIAALVRWPRMTLMRIGLTALVIVDVGASAVRTAWEISPVTAAMLAPPPYVAALREELDRRHERLLSLTPATTLTPNLNLLWQLPEANGYVSLLLARPGEMLLMQPDGNVRPDVYERAGDPALNAAAVRYVVFAANFPGAAAFASDPKRWKPIPGTAPDLVYENLQPHPRLWLVHDAVTSTDERAHAAMRGGPDDLSRIALIEGAAIALHSKPMPGERAAIVEAGDDRLVYDVTCATACFLVTSDAYFEGWHATIDGASAPVYRTGYALRGVSVPAGRHRVVVSYLPWSLVAGAAISVLALIALAATLRWRVRSS
jgi:hypothetical protein